MLLKRGDSVLQASVFPTAQLYQCEVDLHALSPAELEPLRLVRIEAGLVASPMEIAGAPMHPPRVAPGFSTRDLPVEPSAIPLLRRLRTSTALSSGGVAHGADAFDPCVGPNVLRQ
jgi:hypothetical protein